ncbi:tetratricopeptide repeat-containing sensor histidine kinase [Winogradskyella flava]|uniref:tetratricopeptide repeat-containing sensor histidine kinase n=1 Tax=Winogradskyella flava TaxID=1884876 RepID=UPI0024934806|nr:tetratricopeptide repeat protein [Winogradskyella flava]
MNFIKSLLLLSILFFSSEVIAQNKVIDSLKSELQMHLEKDTVRVKILYNIVKNNYENDFESNIDYINEAEKISKEIGYKKGVPVGLFYRGLVTSFKSNYNSGDEYYKKAIPLYKDLNMNSQVLACYRNLSVINVKRGDFNNAIYFRKQRLEYRNKIGNEKTENDLFYIGYNYYKIGKYDECLAYYNKALLVSKQNNNQKYYQYSLTAIGNLFSHQGKYQLALGYFNEALISAEKHSNTKNISDAYVSIGNVYIRLQDYDKAISFHKRALEQPNHDNFGTISHNIGESYKYKKDYVKALIFFKDALKTYIEKANKQDEAITLNKIGEIYFAQNDFDTSYQYFEKAKLLNIKVDNQRGLAGSYLGLGKIFLKKSNYDLALDYAIKSRYIGENLELLDIQRDIQQLLFNIYKEKTNYKKALESHELYKTLNDSIFNKENIEKITQLEYEYKYKQQIDSLSINELKLTKTIKATSQDLEDTQRNYLWAIIGVLLLSILLGAIMFNQKLKNAKSKTQTALMEQKLLRSQMTPHFIFNSLSVLQGMILNKEEKKSIQYLSKFSKLLRVTLENSRDKTVLLSQELTAVQDYITLQNLENDAYECTILVDGSIDVPSFEIPPMLIQPFVENAIEHAFVNMNVNPRIDIKLRYIDKKLVCTIADNGVGIDYENGTKRKDKKSMATTITSERLQTLSKDFNTDGGITIEDRKKYNEKGTLVTLVIPYKINAA